MSETEALVPQDAVDAKKSPAQHHAPALPAALDETSEQAVAEAAAVALRPFADIPVDLTIEVGRLHMHLKEMVDLQEGVILPIAKTAGEPFDVCVNGEPVARGEVIIVEDSTGIRITDILKL